MRMVIVMAAASLAALSPAHAADTYGKLFGGVVFGADHDIAANLPGVGSGTGAVDTDTGYGVGGALGYRLSDMFAVEGEVAYRSNNVDSGVVAGTAFDGDGNINSLSFMANGVFTAPGKFGVAPYVGAGAGTAQLGTSGDHDFVFAYQAFAGLNKQLGENLGAAVEYRYFGADDATFTDGPATLTTEYATHSVNLVLTRRF